MIEPVSETQYLLASPVNAARLLSAIAELDRPDETDNPPDS